MKAEDTMALISCPECKNRLSETADRCPKCGCKLTPEMTAEIRKKDLQAQKLGAIGCLSILVILLIIYVIGSYSSKKDPSATFPRVQPVQHTDSKKIDSGTDKSLATKRLSKVQIIKARSNFKVNVLSHEICSIWERTQCPPDSDYLRIKITNNSNVTLPLLTVRINRYEGNTLVGWSRDSSIPVNDLKPGESKECDYYPTGHLSFASVTKITLDIEKNISKKDEQFFDELNDDRLH